MARELRGRLRGLERAAGRARGAGLRIIALRNFENGGYPGPALREFVARYGRSLLDAPNWTFGEVPAAMARAYNPQRYPDIYFLVDEKGVIRAMDGAPGATMARITRFVAQD